MRAHVDLIVIAMLDPEFASSCSSDQIVELRAKFVEAIGEEVLIDVVGDRNGGVAELVLDELGVCALVPHQRRCGMTQLVYLQNRTARYKRRHCA